MSWLNALVIAFSTYSKIPMPQVEWSDGNRRYTMCFFPLIGAVIGAAMWLWLWLCDYLALGDVLRGAVGAALPLVITGGIHMDGLMDTADALSSWQGRERRLEILKDSHTGAFAVMTCAAYLLVTCGVLSEANAADAPALGMVYVASRSLSALTMALFQSARPDGMLGGFARAARRRAVCAAGGIYLAICAAVWGITLGWAALLPIGAACLCTAGYRRMAYRAFGGVTGDLAGWLTQVTELCCAAAVVMGGKLL